MTPDWPGPNVRNPFGCGCLPPWNGIYLPPWNGIYIAHCARHHPAGEVRYGAHGCVTFDCAEHALDGDGCPCADRDEAARRSRLPVPERKEAAP